MRPKRTSALLAVERMQKIARWEACSENSAEFRAAAAQIDAELQSETRRGVVTVTDIDDDVDGDDTPDDAAPGQVHHASTEAPGADDRDVDSVAGDESDEYESSFIDDDEVSSVEGSESCVSSMSGTSESDNTSIEADAEVDAKVNAGVDAEANAEADVDRMLQELPGASENFEDCLGPWPHDEPVNYSHDDIGLEAVVSHRDLCDLDESEIFEDNN